MDAVNNMKLQVIKDVEYFFRKMKRGYSPNYQHILNKILFIETVDFLDTKESIYEKLLAL